MSIRAKEYFDKLKARLKVAENFKGPAMKMLEAVKADATPETLGQLQPAIDLLEKASLEEARVMVGIAESYARDEGYGITNTRGLQEAYRNANIPDLNDERNLYRLAAKFVDDFGLASNPIQK